jgi:hypothetical protein
MYYIDKKLKDWPGNHGLEYPLSQTLFYGTKEMENAIIAKNRGEGWHFPEESGNWTSSKKAILYMATPINPEENYTLVFKANAFHPQTADQKVSIYIDKDFVQDIYIKNEQVFEVPLPKGLEKKTWSLQFVIDNPRSPAEYGSGGDTRQLGMFLEWLRLDKST